MELPISLKTFLLKKDCSIVFLYVQWCGMTNKQYVFCVHVLIVMFPDMSFLPNYGFQVYKPKIFVHFVSKLF